MSRRISLEPLYRAAADLRLNDFLEDHLEMVDVDVVRAVDEDFRHALEFGDVAAAALAAEISAVLRGRLGDTQGSVERFLALVRALALGADTAEDLEKLHASALSAGARAQDVGRGADVIECWMVAADAQLQLAEVRNGGLYPSNARLAHVGRGLRHAADLAEAIAEQPLANRDSAVIRRFTILTARLAQYAFEAEWPDRELLGVRALLRRLSRSAERVIPADALTWERGSGGEDVKRELMRLFTVFSD